MVLKLFVLVDLLLAIGSHFYIDGYFFIDIISHFENVRFE
jgi:hypothetical protein